MKIQLNNSGQVIDERLNRAQRLIRLGLATVYIEPVKPKIKKVKKEKNIEDKITTEQEYSTKKIPSWRDN